MELINYRNRLIEKKIETYLKVFGAILIEGPKWCGKTWTGKYMSKSGCFLADPTENFNNKRLVELNYDRALDGETPRLIDEWQEIPALWDAVRWRVDEIPKKGQFILTGSSVVSRSSYIHSGTGRIVRLKMRTMSLYESGKSSGQVSLYDIVNNKEVYASTERVSLEQLIEYVVCGGRPIALNSNDKDGPLIAKQYVKSLLNEDINKLNGVKRDVHKIELLLKSLARNESTTATNTTLRNDIKDKDTDNLSLDTITDYLNLLNSMFLLDNIPPFSTKIRSSLRLKQSEKRHFVDPSIPCALLNISTKSLLNNLDLLGFLFESMVLRDLLIYVDSFDGKLFHYQDYNGHEIDAVIEMDEGSWCGIEIKLGASQIDVAANNLIKINEQIKKENGKEAKALCVICGLSSAAYRRKDGVFVVPITALKD